MKTEILLQYQPPQDWDIYKVLPVFDGNYIVYRYRYPDEFVIEIFGSSNRIIDVSEMVKKGPGIAVHYHGLFSYKNGFGLRDWNNSRILLWTDLEADHTVINVQQSPQSQIEMRSQCIAFASFDATDNKMLLGINDDKGPSTLAKYWTTIDFQPTARLLSQGKDLTIEWNDVHQLDPKLYPQTYFHYQYPWREWLNITDIAKLNRRTYIHTTGGQKTRMRSGPEYEFSILSALNEENTVLKNLEVDEGKSSFSANQKYFIQRPKKRKRLLIYNLEEMELAYDIALKPQQNLGKMDGKNMVRADLHDDTLYVYQFHHLNVCRLIN